MDKKWVYLIGGLICVVTVTSIVIPLTLHFLSKEQPIIIMKDEDFENYNFPGDGSKNNPFIIENYTITTKENNAILIFNTTKYFIIRNCTLEATTIGISIDSIASGTAMITQNVCRNNWDGIYVSRSVNVTLTNNTCYNNYDSIKLYSDVSNIFLANNNLSNNQGRGIFSRSSNSVFVNNTCINNEEFGIAVINSFNVTLIDNFCSNNVVGIFMDNSANTTLTNNTLNKNNNGLRLMSESNFNLIIFNSFGKNSNYAITFALNSANNTIHHNSFLDNTISGSSQAEDNSSNNTWYDNTTNEGNYWSDWFGTGNYTIDGSANAVDLYPLINPPVTSLQFSLGILELSNILCRGMLCSSYDFIL